MNYILQFAASTAGLFAALGALLSGVASLILAADRVRRHVHLQRRSEMTRPTPLRFHILMMFFLPGVLLLLVAGAIFAARAVDQQEQPLNVQLTTAAWNAFNAGDYEAAIAHTDKRINEFRGSADREQAELEKSGAPLPPKGKVSEETKKAILARGLLNDVATCFYIKGRSAENLGRKEDAKLAYQQASKYTYARCWDPKGWFWSPAEVSQDRLGMLQ